VTSQEADKTTVVHLEDYKNMTIITNIIGPGGRFQSFQGGMTQIS
jgi:molybdenum cofactor biosynthesis MoaF-like protein